MSRPILVFDSGIGGLSVLAEIRQRLPTWDYCYLFDNARLPYGELSEQTLVDGCVALVCAVAQRVNAALVVIACNTASTLVLSHLRARLTIPVVGVVPAIKPAAGLSRTGHIGLLATPGTVRRSYTQDLVNKFASHCRVHMFGCSELVVIAEQKAAGQLVDIGQIEELLAPVKAEPIDVLVLGCTHFPVLAEEFSRVLGEGVLLVDSGAAIAARVCHLLAGESQSVVAEPSRMSAWHTTASISVGLQSYLAMIGFTEIAAFNP